MKFNCVNCGCKYQVISYSKTNKRILTCQHCGYKQDAKVYNHNVKHTRKDDTDTKVLYVPAEDFRKEYQKVIEKLEREKEVNNIVEVLEGFSEYLKETGGTPNVWVD